MIARTKLQVEVMNLTKHLPDIEGKVFSWAKVDCLRHVGFGTKNRVICMECGQKFPTDLIKYKKAICPHCKVKLDIEQTSKRTYSQDIYVAYAQVYGEFQVIRNFELRSHHKVDKPVRFTFFEILQHWILPNGKREVIACNHTANYNCDSWNGYLEIRNKSDINRYDVYPRAFHPNSVFKPAYKKIGINYKLRGLTALEAIYNITSNPKSETLLKAHQYSLLEHLGYHDYRIGKYWDSIKICIRNKYTVKDAKIWTDYLDLLSYFKKDLNNAHFVCPKNLNKEHDIYVRRKRKIMDYEQMQRDYINLLRYFGEKVGKDFVYPKNLKAEYKILYDRQTLERLEKRKKELSEMDLKYKQSIQQFLDMQFVDKEIIIIPLKSIDEFKVEGDLLKHCVYTNEYFKKKNCLILSARIGDKRIETIEVNLKSIKVEQSRAIRNTNSEYHQRILDIMNRNLKQIRSRVKQPQTA